MFSLILFAIYLSQRRWACPRRPRSYYYPWLWSGLWRMCLLLNNSWRTDDQQRQGQSPNLLPTFSSRFGHIFHYVKGHFLPKAGIVLMGCQCQDTSMACVGRISVERVMWYFTVPGRRLRLNAAVSVPPHQYRFIPRSSSPPLLLCGFGLELLDGFRLFLWRSRVIGLRGQCQTLRPRRERRSPWTSGRGHRNQPGREHRRRDVLGSEMAFHNFKLFAMKLQMCVCTKVQL